MTTPGHPHNNAGILVFEIGNSHATVAATIAGEVRVHERFAHDQTPSIIEFAARAWDALPDKRLRAIAAASVVPETLRRLRKCIGERLDAPVLVVGEDLHRPLSLAVESPEAVGVDRICAAAAAYDAVEAACCVASFGTAVTIDCVNDEGVFMGGAILPGVDLQAKALHEGTACLPLVSIGPTGAVYGGNTEDAIRNGILFGLVGSLREIAERYATELHTWPQLIATGGNAELINEHCDFIDNVVPDLCIQGIALAHRKHYARLASATQGVSQTQGE